MSDITTRRKTVRFALDDEPTTPTPKKTIRFALEDEIVPRSSTPSLDVIEKPSLDRAVEASTPTLSTASQTSSSTNYQLTHSTLSQTEIRTWSEEVSSCVPLQDTPALHRSYSDDRGEKDAAGRVVEASTEPCEKCGGKVVWATRGEWLMICGECQEPQ